MQRFFTSLFVLGCAACATPEPQPTTNTPEPAAGEVADRGFGPWQATLDADHSLVGTAWSPAEGRVLTRDELEQRLLAARFVLLGETHDHPDHHRLQGELIAALIAGAATAEQAPAVAYEMLDPATQAQIDAFAPSPEQDAAEAFASLVDWANSGWPEWPLYRPAFAPVLDAHLPILAAQFPRSASKRYMAEGLAVLEGETVSRYGLDQPLDAELQAAWLDEMFVSHCEMVPREQLTPMVEIQRIRDAVMADAMLSGAKLRPQAVLVAGTGHTRDQAVPRLLRMTGISDDEILSIGFTSVDAAHAEAGDYGDEHDIIVLTPGVEREDPCKSMRPG